MTSNRTSVVVCLLLAVVGGCGTQTPVVQEWTRTEIYLGMSRPDGSGVSDSDWKDFLDTSVTPRFPDGLTVMQAQGRYRMNDQSLIVEPTGVLVILHRGDGADEKINAICQDYARRFGQESVLRTDTPAKTSFVRPKAAHATGVDIAVAGP
jgi:hypothetical protein